MRIDQLPKNKIVFTTKFVVQEKVPIIYVTFDEDGDLHFLGQEEASMEDAMIVSLDQILNLDNTLLLLPSLEIGSYYERDSQNQRWIKGKNE